MRLFRAASRPTPNLLPFRTRRWQNLIRDLQRHTVWRKFHSTFSSYETFTKFPGTPGSQIHYNEVANDVRKYPSSIWKYTRTQKVFNNQITKLRCVMSFHDSLKTSQWFLQGIMSTPSTFFGFFLSSFKTNDLENDYLSCLSIWCACVCLCVKVY